MGLQVPVSLPAGCISPFAGAVAPAGWLFMYGQAVSRATYAALFLAIGTTFGAGDGSTTFNLPDARGRALFGKDDMGGAAANRLTTGNSGVNGAALGAAGGAETTTLSSAQNGAHNHGVTGADRAFPLGSAGAASSGGGVLNISSATAISVASNGSGSAHQNVPPAVVVNYIIKT